MPTPASLPTVHGSCAPESGCVSSHGHAAICLPEGPCLISRCREYKRLHLLATLPTDLDRYNAAVRILISAGEASGEMYGAQLIEALRLISADRTNTRNDGGEGPNRLRSGQVRATQALEFFGVGGERMRAAGCDTVVDAKDLSVVGITEILSHLPKIWGLFHKLIAAADKRRPDVAIVIDSPAFNWRIAKQMKKRGVPVVYYVCPQFWAWRQGRVRLLRKYVDKALVIFPFEDKFYRDRGVNAEFVGHPLAELSRPAISRYEYAALYGLDPDKHWIALMPGSRVKEVRMNLPGILESARLLGNKYEFILPLAPTLESGFVQQLVKSHPSTGSVQATSKTAKGGAVSQREGTAFSGGVTAQNETSGMTKSPALPDGLHLVREALSALAHSRAGIIASGTATVEAAMMETPFVMVYRVTRLTYLLGRSTVRVPHFAMANLIAGEQVVPELVQQNFTAERVAAEITRIIPDGEPRETMIAGLRAVRTSLSSNRDGHPAERAARSVFALLRTRTPGSATP